MFVHQYESSLIYSSIPGAYVSRGPALNSVQKVRFLFVSLPSCPFRFEFLEPIDTSSPISNFLHKNGPGLHHTCFRVDNLDISIDKLQRSGFQLLVPPILTWLLMDARYALHSTIYGLIELVEVFILRSSCFPFILVALYLKTLSSSAHNTPENSSVRFSSLWCFNSNVWSRACTKVIDQDSCTYNH